MKSVAKLKVVHISTFRSGGAGRAAYRIHEALLKGGIDSSFLTLEDLGADCSKNFSYYYQLREDWAGDPNFFEREKNRIRFRIKKHLKIVIKSNQDNERERMVIFKQLAAIRNSIDCEIASLPFASFDILKNTLIKQADIIHLHWVAEMLDYPSFFKNNKKPVLWTLHDMNPFQGLFHYKQDEIKNKEICGDLDETVRKIKRKAIKKRKSNLKLVTPSLWLLKAARQSNIFRKVKSCSIANPLDTDFFKFHNKNEFKKLNGIPENNVVLLFVTQTLNNYRKGFDLLAGAIEKLGSKSVTLLVLGEGEKFEIKDIDIRYLGSVNNDECLRDYYSLADAFIIPSREDNLPNVMLESLACGTAVISFPVGGIKEHVINFETGLLADNISAESLAKAIEKFCMNQEMFKREVIRNYAEKKYNEELIASQYIKVYEKLMKKRKFYA